MTSILYSKKSMLMKCLFHFHQACVSQLREMFPNMPKEFLKKTLQENDEDLNLAVADILKSRECK